jgi:hypothetical protein
MDLIIRRVARFSVMGVFVLSMAESAYRVLLGGALSDLWASILALVVGLVPGALFWPAIDPLCRETKEEA